MTTSGPDNPRPNMRLALKPVMNEFEAAALETPDLMTYNRRREIQAAYSEPDYDPFGDLAHGTFNLFMDKADEYIRQHAHKIEDPTELIELRRRFMVSQLGIGVIALFSEIAPLVYIRDVPNAELSPEQAANVTNNSYDFIDKILKSGSRVGPAIVNVYIQPDVVEGRGWHYESAIFNGNLLHPDRLERFKLKMDDENGPKLDAIDLDYMIRRWQREAKEVGLVDNTTNCPAGIYRDPESMETYARRLFDLMVNHIRDHIYPDYLPEAKTVIETERAAGRLVTQHDTRD